MDPGDAENLKYDFPTDKKKTALYAAFFMYGAGNETRTRDPNLGKVVLYQLSYSRVEMRNFTGRLFHVNPCLGISFSSR